MFSLISRELILPSFNVEILAVLPNLVQESILNDCCFDQLDRLPKSLEKHDKNLYFLTNKIAESLGGSGYSVERLTVPYVPQVTGMSSKVLH